MRFYSKNTGSTYIDSLHKSIPADAVPIDEDRYQKVIANPALGKIRTHDSTGLPILIDPARVTPTAPELCERIDVLADAARAVIVGEPTRAIEYERTAAEAAAFKAAGYPSDNVPRSVAAWAINGRSPRQAADSILAKAAAYTEALYQIRETRLQAKELIRHAVEAGDTDGAQGIAAEFEAAHPDFVKVGL